MKIAATLIVDMALKQRHKTLQCADKFFKKERCGESGDGAMVGSNRLYGLAGLGLGASDTAAGSRQQGAGAIDTPTDTQIGSASQLYVCSQHILPPLDFQGF